MTQIAREHGVGYLDVEDMYQRIGQTIALLLRNEWYQSSYDAALESLIYTTYVLLVHPGTLQILKPDLRQNIKMAVENIDKVRNEIFHQETLPREISLFLRVVDAMCTQYTDAGYDPSGVIDSQEHMLAKMINENFEAYRKTLNS